MGWAFLLTLGYLKGGYIVNGGANATIAYNANWNRTVKTAPGAPNETSAFTYSTNLISTFTVAGSPAKTFVLDAKKNTLNNGRGVFAYDLKNNLVQATVNGVVSTYAFDALNQRVSKTVGDVATRFIYDEAGNLAGEYDGAGAVKAEHIYLGALPVGVRMNGSAHRVHTDSLGTPRPSSDPFGGNAPPVASIVYNPRFPGQYFDAESGLHHNKHRAYDPVLGRYMQPDPLGLDAGKSSFNYVNQNPLNAKDPDGLSPYPITDGAIGPEIDFRLMLLTIQCDRSGKRRLEGLEAQIM